MNTATLRLAASSLLLAAALVSVAGAQTRRGGGRAVTPAVRPVNEFSAKDWERLGGALAREDWSPAVAMSRDMLARLTRENDKRQLAQLRYLHVFALAGQTNAYISGGNGRGAAESWTTLDAVLKTLDGKEMVMPARAFESDCRNRVNFVCPVRGNQRALRVTSTTKEGDAILSFEYFSFDSEVPFSELERKKVFLGGILEKAEFNSDQNQPWIVRLFFRKAEAGVSTDR